MRVIFVISHLIYGGAETQLIGLARELSQMGNAVAIYTLNRANPRADELADSGVQLVADQKRMRLDPAVLFRLRRFMRNFRADVVHSFLFDADIYSRISGIGLGIPIFNSERNDDYSLNFLQRLIHWPTRHLAHAVIANSHSGARFAQRMFGFSESRVHCVWNGINLPRLDQRVQKCTHDYRKEFFGDQAIKVACLVGSIKPQKDYLLALQVAKVLLGANPEWRVLFVGDQLTKTGDYKARVIDAYQALDHRNKIVFTGLRRDVPEIMAQCNVVFSTSQHEGFPNIVLEAMAVGTPVVSTAYSDIGQILPLPWQIVSDRSPVELAATIVRAAVERNLLGPLQRRWVESHATLSISAQKLRGIYTSTLEI